jgi:hypothetical protein
MSFPNFIGTPVAYYVTTQEIFFNFSLDMVGAVNVRVCNLGDAYANYIANGETDVIHVNPTQPNYCGIYGLSLTVGASYDVYLTPWSDSLSNHGTIIKFTIPIPIPAKPIMITKV